MSVVCFRHRSGAVADLDVHNHDLARALQADGRVYVADAVVDGATWLRPCFVNYRTRESDVLALVEIVREVGEAIAGR